jgi:hypothetical protein
MRRLNWVRLDEARATLLASGHAVVQQRWIADILRRELPCKFTVEHGIGAKWDGKAGILYHLWLAES